MSAVAHHLKAKGIAFEQIPHEQTYTSIEEARALGIAADEVLKTIVLTTSSGHFLAVIPGSRRLEMRLVEEATGDRHVRLAREDEIERDFPGYELGAIPPLGSLLGLPALVDPEVMEHETVVFAAGAQTESVSAKAAELFRDEKITLVPLTRHPEDEEPKR